MQSVFGSLAQGGPGTFTQTDVADLSGRTALVTGGTQSIGFEVGRAFALAKARVLLLSRKTENGEKAVNTIKEQVPGADVKFVECDLGDLHAVKAVGDQICKNEQRLDLVILDAGIGVNKFDLSASGLDRHFTVNHLGHFLLVNRLLPVIRRTAALRGAPAPRIVSVSSELHRATPSSVSFASEREVSEDVGLGPSGFYARSKLANILFTRYGLVERVFVPNGDRVFALATHPGAVHTEQQKQMTEAYGALLGTLVKAVSIPFMRSPEQGSLSTLWAATSEDVEKNGWNGRYFIDPCQLAEGSSQAQDPELGRRLWELSNALVKQKLGLDGLLPWDVQAKA
ncbi:hypothetical protein BD413DRAFT_489575 [Trametes elegans]|nr:hypothetical protein BD413DRAFT_489575 [Trametes elegans]